MQARQIEKVIEVDGRRFIIRKYSAMTGVKIGKVLLSKLLPTLQSILPMLAEMAKSEDRENLITQFFDRLDAVLSLDQISHALDLVTGDDLEFIMRESLMCCFEELPAGKAPVMMANGTYGVEGIEFDLLLVLRLVAESVRWGLGDFFSGGRLNSILGFQTDSSL